ncbi:MAG: hypothetical protein ACRD5I_08805, partial [Candidatus Acidiferrales bacterium]
FETSYSYSPNYLREPQRIILDGGFQLLFGPFSARNHVHQVAFNYVRYLRKGRVRPFATGGVGFAHFTASLRPTKFAANFGGGVDLELNPWSAIRFEFRDYLVGAPLILDVSPRGLDQQYGPSLGIAVKF